MSVVIAAFSEASGVRPRGLDEAGVYRTLGDRAVVHGPTFALFSKDPLGCIGEIHAGLSVGWRRSWRRYPALRFDGISISARPLLAVDFSRRVLVEAGCVADIRRRRRGRSQQG